MKISKDYPFFYIINGQFYENSDTNSKKLKKITLIFEDDESKVLRSSALEKFIEIRDTYLIKNRAAAPKYHVIKNIGKSTCVDAIENVPFYANKSKLTLALTVSFGIKEASTNYNLIDSDRYPYNKNLYPIAAIGQSLHDIEDSLKVNLILEKQFYNLYGSKFEEVNSIKDFIDVNLLKDYIISNCMKAGAGASRNAEMLKKVLNNEFLEIFPTAQFYGYKTEEKLIKTEGKTFLELYAQDCDIKQREKVNIYTKEIELINKFYELLHGKNSNYANSTRNRISSNLRLIFVTPFFTKKQISIHAEIQEKEAEFYKEYSREEIIPDLIKAFL